MLNYISICRVFSQSELVCYSNRESGQICAFCRRPVARLYVLVYSHVRPPHYRSETCVSSLLMASIRDWNSPRRHSHLATPVYYFSPSRFFSGVTQLSGCSDKSKMLLSGRKTDQRPADLVHRETKQILSNMRIRLCFVFCDLNLTPSKMVVFSFLLGKSIKTISK